MNQYKVSMFPGQGAQYPEMGKGLFTRFKYHVRLADMTLGYSIEEVCSGQLGDLNQTQYIQPALYTVNVLHYLDYLDKHNHETDVFLGHSLGEYCALMAAGAFSFETGLAIVQERGRCMASCTGGGMAATLGLPLEMLEGLIARAAAQDLCIANYNAPTQFVLSGSKMAIEQFETHVLTAGGKYYPLNVSGAFHSKQMLEITQQFRAFLSRQTFYPLQKTVVSNVTAQPYPKHDSQQLIELLVRQLHSPVLWQQSVSKLTRDNPILCYEFGPQQVVSKLTLQSVKERVTLIDVQNQEKKKVGSGG